MPSDESFCVVTSDRNRTIDLLVFERACAASGWMGLETVWLVRAMWQGVTWRQTYRARSAMGMRLCPVPCPPVAVSVPLPDTRLPIDRGP